MENHNEKHIRAQIKEINLILDEDEKTGHLSDKAFKYYWQKLHQLERDLMRIYIIRHLTRERKMPELDLSLLPIYDDTGDSDMTNCMERHEASCYFHKKSDSLQK